MNGRDFIEGVQRSADVGTDAETARYLGLTVTALRNWRGRRTITVRQMVGLLVRVRKQAEQRTQRTAIQPIVEFFPLDPVEASGGARWEIFPVLNEGGQEHPYLAGLKEQLDTNRGIYIFYDSRGRALYAGKARRQSLWREIKGAYNRERQVQRIRRVDHPTRRQRFRTTDEKRRQIRLRSMLLRDLAAYISAYRVADGVMGDLESFLIRGFPNDLLNVRMENFEFD